MSIWFMIEFNFLCFIRIISYDLVKLNTNGNIYYFLIQSLGRVLILIRSLNFLLSRNFLFEFFFSIFLLLKLGGAPFQFWYLKLIQKIRWRNIWLMSVWQKLIPLLLIKLLKEINLVLFGVLSVIIGRINNLNQKKIKKILGLSSIFSLGWVLLSMLQSNIWLLFILGYGLILITLLSYIKRLRLYNTDSLENLNFSVLFYILFFVGLLIISGIPPFVIFYIKILILFELIQYRFILVFLLLLLRVLIIYIYLMIGFSLLTFIKNKIFFKSIYFFNTYLINYVLYNFLFRIFFIRFL